MKKNRLKNKIRDYKKKNKIIKHHRNKIKILELFLEKLLIMNNSKKD